MMSGTFPAKHAQVYDKLKPHFNRKYELSTHQGCKLWGNRVIVPQRLSLGGMFLTQELCSPNGTAPKQQEHVPRTMFAEQNFTPPIL